MLPTGEGWRIILNKYYLEIENTELTKLKNKLNSEGLFSKKNKEDIPNIINNAAVLTSKPVSYTHLTLPTKA